MRTEGMIPLAPSSSEGLLIRGDFDLHTFRTTVSGCVDFILSFIDWHQCTVKVELHWGVYLDVCPWLFKQPWGGIDWTCVTQSVTTHNNNMPSPTSSGWPVSPVVEKVNCRRAKKRIHLQFYSSARQRWCITTLKQLFQVIGRLLVLYCPCQDGLTIKIIS